MKTFYALEPHVNGTTKYAVGDKREADENEVRHLVDLKVLGVKPPKAVASTKSAAQVNYERDNLKALDLKKANKEQLLVIAAYEQAEVPQGDEATNAELVAAIEAKRKA